MIHQKVRVKEGVEIEIIMPKVPYRIINRAEQLITKILFNDILTGMRPKVIQRNKKLFRTASGLFLPRITR